jgi:hypothetical protein
MADLSVINFLKKILPWQQSVKTGGGKALDVPPPAAVDLYSTHQEYLREIFAFKGRLPLVLEFGTGHYSTGLLIGNSDKCISIEMQSADWHGRMLEKFSKSENWEPYLSIGPMKWTGIVLPETIHLGFVDGHGESRPECINYLMGKGCPIIVSHDTEEPGYGWGRVNENNSYMKIVFSKHPNWTTLWTTDALLFDHFTGKKIR